MKIAIVSRLLVVSAFLALLIAGPVTGATGKGRKVTCKGGKVPVTVGKMTTCQPIAKAIPKPQAIDIRLAYLQESLKRDVSKSGGRKARRSRSLQSGFGAAGKRAQKKFLKALPRALALLDRKAGGKAGSSSLPAGPAFASACSANGPVDPVGSVAGVGVALAGDNGGQMTINSGGLTFRMRFAKCGGGGGFFVPECPTASGDVSASGNSKFEVTEEVLEGDKVVSRRNTSVDNRRRARGKVAADAKLDYIIVNSVEQTFIVASGGLVQRGTTEREVKVNMRTGNYDPSEAKVKISGDAEPSDGASSFASVVQDAMEAFRVGEVGGSFLRDDGWSTFNRKRGPYCANAVFSPDSNTLKLRKGKTGQVGIYAKAQDGGRATGAKWTLLAPLNADFSPGASEDASPTFQYTVAKSPQGKEVKVTVKFSSTAGVGETTWIQQIEPSNGITHLTGEFGGEFKGPSHVQGALEGRTEQTWHGSIALEGELSQDRKTGIFELTSGSITIEASGLDGSGLSGCLQEALTTEEVLGAGLVISSLEPDGGPPYEYLINTALPSHALSIRRVGCDQYSKEMGFEGTEYPVTPHYEFFVEGQVSADGIEFSGTVDESVGEVTFVQYWNLHGTE